MKIRITTCLSALVLATGLLPGPAAFAHAAEEGADAWVPVKHLEFSPDDVEGGVSGPEGELIESVPRATQPSLIELRQGFEVELVKTMENL